MKKSLIIVLPVYNEEKDLQKNLPVLHAYAKEHLDAYDWAIVIAEQASTDATPHVAQELAQKYPKVSYVHLSQKGRGGALRHVWQTIPADYYSYTDIDLSSQIRYFPELFRALDNNHQLAIGSRLSNESRVVGRTVFREIISRSYNLLIRATFSARFLDAQCGFKAITKEVVEKIIPHIENDNWFFDSELLILAEKAGFSTKVVAIEWRDDPGSTVRILKTAFEDIKGLTRLFFKRPWKKIPAPTQLKLS